MYILTFCFIEIRSKDNTFLFVFGNLAEYFSVIWIVFIRCFDFVLIGNMDFAEIKASVKNEKKLKIKNTNSLPAVMEVWNLD